MAEAISPGGESEFRHEDLTERISTLLHEDLTDKKIDKRQSHFR